MVYQYIVFGLKTIHSYEGEPCWPFAQQVETNRYKIYAYPGIKKVKSLIFQFGLMPVNRGIFGGEWLLTVL